ncbi:MAG: CpaF family protein [Planctomycetota bacterium]|nr:CpaF family protein [Planctomycetota bacterium]
MPTVFEQSLQFFLAPIQDLLDDESVSEVMINGPDTIYVERAGKIQPVPNKFQGHDALFACARNVAQFSGKRVEPTTPRFDARLPDGSRVHVVLPPVARDGVSIAIRKFSISTITLDKLIEWGSLNEESVELLRLAVILGKNIVVSGGTGSGKTALLNALSGAIPSGERILVMEDTSELQLQQEHVVRLEARAADRYGRGQVTIRDLLHSALRLRPDRVIVGECRGGEALDMIQAMNTGHDGSMTTVHANSPIDALSRVETLALMSGVEIPLVPLRAQVASAVDLIVQPDRLPDGSRKVTAIADVMPLDEHGRYVVAPLMRFEHEGRDKKTGAIRGAHKLTGTEPRFWGEVKAKGLTEHATALKGAFS